MKQRVNIVYNSRGETRFDWHHYLNKHLPLACGISSRHALITKCDVDQPITLNNYDGATVVAICTVYFEDLLTQNQFRAFFASGHQDAATILADEPNYTDITPSFNAGWFDITRPSDSEFEYRLRILFSLNEQIPPASAAPIITTILELIDSFEDDKTLIGKIELDHCTDDVPEGSSPAYCFIASLYFSDLNNLEICARKLSPQSNILDNLRSTSGLSANVCVARVKKFDLALCKPYLENNG